MSSSYSDLKIQLMATGENTTTWGDVTNNNWTALSEAVANSADVAFASANVTISLTNTNAAQTARNLRLNLTGTSGGARTLTVPTIEKLYLVNNGLADVVTVKTGAGTGINVAAGKSMFVYVDGTNVVDAVTAVSSLNVAGGFTLGLTGLLKGAGSSNTTTATAGTDYAAPNVSTTFTATQIFSGSTSNVAASLLNAKEPMNIVASAATGTINQDLSTSSIYWYTTNAAANWTLNFRQASGTALNSVMSVGDSVTAVFAANNGATAYYPSAIQVDGTATNVTTKWLGGTVSAGTASATDIYSFVIVKTATTPAYTVFASQSGYV